MDGHLQQKLNYPKKKKLHIWGALRTGKPPRKSMNIGGTWPWMDPDRTCVSRLRARGCSPLVGQALGTSGASVRSHAALGVDLRRQHASGVGESARPESTNHEDGWHLILFRKLLTRRRSQIFPYSRGN